MPMHEASFPFRRVAAALAILPGLGQAMPGAACPPQVYPQEARRYELDGKTSMRFSVGQDGKVATASVARSSGWKVLDDAALSNVRQCVFPADRTAKENFSVQYTWDLDDTELLRPLLVPGSCQPSPRVQGYNNLDKSTSNDSGVVLRMFIGSEGAPARIVAEAPGLPAELVEAAITYVQGCRFAIDPGVGGTRSWSTYGKVLLRSQPL
ncbi:energy transducer TonB [Janthinobacterium sp. FT14W]|uniref:energy transducer TonB n=1 Tax=Janthinobacterium sp. FT14W TaxID=2654253 RepID=UPI00186AD7E7|nr:energy transducer TonB [Janthinobacterium sp. FT14W]